MTEIAFYAPLKSPLHPNASGDRLISQLFIKALTLAGFNVKLASQFRSRDGAGNPAWQQRAIITGKKLAQRLIRQWKKQQYRPDAWFTYHLYYKAPDLIGPHICRHYNIPYIVAEASWAGKRASGNWQLYHQQLESSLLTATLVFTLNPGDEEALKRFLPDHSRLTSLAPFLDLEAQQQVDNVKLTINRNIPRIITIAMMRPGDKLASYRLLAEAISHVSELFQWFIVGDGKESQTVRSLFKNDSRIHFTGFLQPEQVRALLAQCELHIWPAVNEAFGMTLLEAQYQGVAILSGDEGGVSHIMADGITGQLVPARDPKAFGLALQALLKNPQQLKNYRDHAKDYVCARHDMKQASKILKNEIDDCIDKFQ